MADKKNSSLSRHISYKFLFMSAVTSTIIFGLVFFLFSRLQEEHIMEQVRKQAVILHKQIVITRQWVADNGCILVKKSAETTSSPFFKNPDIETKDGTTYTKVNPSVLTKILSDRALKGGLYSFKLTNTEGLNPSNMPDEFEKDALKLFRNSGSDGIFRAENIDEKPVLRYVAPLYVTDTCLQCHVGQDYKAGEIGGCLSVFIPMAEARSAMNRNRAVLIGGGLGFSGSLVLLLFVAASKLVFNPIKDIKAAINRIHVNPGDELFKNAHGDELKEIADFCYTLDEKLKNQHQELERKIADATSDLSRTNKDLESANRELEELNKTKSEFFSDISHELRTPLTGIKGAADIMARKFPCEDLTYLDIIRRNTDHLIKIVVDFLDYSKLEAGRLELDLQMASLETVAADAILSQKAAAQKKSLGLELEAGNNGLFMFDKQRIYQVFINLLSNAMRFSPESGIVTVTLQTLDNGCMRASVKDQGPGLDPEYHSAVFQKFYQLSDSKIHKGTSGIGLAICKGLVEAHGGRIWVESRPGEGCNFCFELPLHKQ